MLKRSYFFWGSKGAGLLLFCLLGGVTMSAENASADLEIRIEVLEAQSPTLKDARVRLCLENNSKKDVTLLNCFCPLEFFFFVELAKDDGTPIPRMSVGGKIEIEKKTYFTLKPNEFFGRVIRLGEICKDMTLEDGKYKLNISYHNQYGENCFKGWIESNTVSFAIKAQAASKPRDVAGEMSSERSEQKAVKNVE